MIGPLDFGTLIGPVARELLGEPNRALSTPRELRFGTRGSFSAKIAGPKAGLWRDHETGAGGGVLALVQHARHCDRAAALDWLRQRGFIGAPEHAPPRPRPAPRPRESPPPDRETSRTLDLARRIWRESLPARGTLVEAYLQARGLALPARCPALRFHPSCPRGTERHPAMVALMTAPENNAPGGVHRTFLRPDGRGKAEGAAKMMAGAGGVIRLSPDDEVELGLGITEGIETGLALLSLAGWRPIWAAASAGAMAKIPVLAGVEAVTLFCDRDDRGAGLDASRECAARWREAGREATGELPPEGNDWLDVLITKETTA